MSHDGLEKILTEDNHGLIYPRYDGHSIYNLIPTIYRLLGIDSKKTTLPDEFYKNYISENRKVVLFVTDGFGYNQAKKLKKQSKFINKLFKDDHIFPITSPFPSTTAASLTTLATGLTPEEHGLFEWYLYLEEIDQIIQTIPFSHLSRKAKSDELLNEGISPTLLIDAQTIYEYLKTKGIDSYIFTPESYANSVFTTISSKGANKLTYRYLSDLIVSLKDFLNSDKNNFFCYVYWPGIDTEGHNYGPNSEQYSIEAKLFFDSLYELCIKNLKRGVSDNTLFLLTSDHGQVEIDSEKTIFLNTDKELISALKLGRDGETILPYGNMRDVFLNIREEKLDKTLVYLKQKYGKQALIVKTEEMIKKGLFGLGNPSDKFLRRVGNAMILPYKNNTIWYQYIKNERVKFKGHHGGLTSDEMLIPFAIARLSELI